MVKRTVSRQRYLVAGVITFLVFGLGIMLGMVMDYERVQYLEDRYQEHQLDYRSLQLQFKFLDLTSNDESTCAAFEEAMENAVAELSDSLGEVERYREFSKTQRENFKMIERRYILDNLQYWVIVEEAMQRCPMDRLSILYFYDEDCQRCPDQGIILTYFKKKYGDALLVFPINVGLAEDEPIIELFKRRFGIEGYPSIVVGEQPFTDRVVSKDELSPIICERLGGDDC